MNHIDNIYDAVLDGDMGVIPESVQTALNANVPAADILKEGMIAAMEEVGRLFEEGEYFVPEMLIAARAMKIGLDLLKPYLIDSGVDPVGKVVVGTVQGDMHDIGKNLVSMMLEGAGFEIIDLGIDVPPANFVEAVREGVDILGLSALLTTTMPSIQDTIQAIEQAGLRDNVKVMIGGAPVTAEYAQQIGADGFAPDAGQAVTLAKSLL
ncbi:corrinoid protein [Candidatus Leptofilum sp.]|uniref:corrinoid protein n=1 Tax=Candidatus Leptofilum sp. TaxID=3241576 RepID=UPI003B5AAE29